MPPPQPAEAWSPAPVVIVPGQPARVEVESGLDHLASGSWLRTDETTSRIACVVVAGEFFVPDQPFVAGADDDAVHAVGRQGGQVVLRR
jgi:hypothetical protein